MIYDDDYDERCGRLKGNNGRNYNVKYYFGITQLSDVINDSVFLSVPRLFLAAIINLGETRKLCEHCDFHVEHTDRHGKHNFRASADRKSFELNSSVKIIKLIGIIIERRKIKQKVQF